jgi:hypothetical protein
MAIIVLADDTLVQELDEVRTRDRPAVIADLKQKNRNRLQYFD